MLPRRAGSARLAGIPVAVLAGLLLVPHPALPATGRNAFVQALDQMMVALGPQSARAGATIRDVYREHLEFLLLNGYTDLEGALDNGGLVPLPVDPHAFNLSPRLDGPNPIGEKDLDNQRSYVSARAATVGMLIEIASQVKSGPVELTSLVRHSHYQEALKTTNANANTSVPMHTMGLAADIGVVNSSLKTAHEIRDVLLRMQRRGDVLFIGERRQLVFHVVPHPSRIGHFTDVYVREVGLPPTSRFVQVVAAGPVRALRSGRATPQVTAEAIAFLPAVEPMAVAALGEDPVPAATDDAPAAAPRAVAATLVGMSPSDLPHRWLILMAGLLGIAWRLAARGAARTGLVERVPSA